MLRAVTRRLSRRAPVVHAVVVVIPAAAALGVLVMAEPDDDRDARRHAAASELPGTPVVSSAPLVEGPRPLPPALAVVALDRRATTATSEELTAIVAAPEHAPGERYLALRRLETLSPSAAVAEAERVAMTHGATDDAWIALNEAWFIPIVVGGLKWAGIAGGTVLASDLIAQSYTRHSAQGVNWTGDQYSPGALNLGGTAAAYGFIGGVTFGAGTAGFGTLGASPLLAEMLAGPLSIGAMDLMRGEVSHPGWYAGGFAAPAVIRGTIASARTAIRLRSGSGGPETGTAAFDELATANWKRFLRWKANLERRGWTVTARELEAGERAFVEVTRSGERHLVYDPRHFRYVDLLHESATFARSRGLRPPECRGATRLREAGSNRVPTTTRFASALGWASPRSI